MYVVPTLVCPYFYDRPATVDPSTRSTSKSPHAQATKTMSVLAVLILGLHATAAFVTSPGPHSRSTTAAGGHSAKAAISTRSTAAARRVDTSRMLASTGFFESLFGGQKASSSSDDISPSEYFDTYRHLRNVHAT